MARRTVATAGERGAAGSVSRNLVPSRNSAVTRLPTWLCSPTILATTEAVSWPPPLLSSSPRPCVSRSESKKGDTNNGVSFRHVIATLFPQSRNNPSSVTAATSVNFARDASTKLAVFTRACEKKRVGADEPSPETPTNEYPRKTPSPPNTHRRGVVLSSSSCAIPTNFAGRSAKPFGSVHTRRSESLAGETLCECVSKSTRISFLFSGRISEASSMRSSQTSVVSPGLLRSSPNSSSNPSSNGTSAALA
mmetsp:Transcript_9169/g.34256  ORF Transcript_9169/g.34256 Transcript_9169/m.34256 type:complete len:250 (-) Transcript_9169:1470-2219(-)